ncbi:MAG: hypothetical protein IPJ74_08925 [Saprospiraceae bacterium]|nr:hypothetical protein [Saprospiraceae bacterium]
MLIPSIDLQSNENTNDHQQNFTDGVNEVLSQAARIEQAAADIAEEFEHGFRFCFYTVPLGTNYR